MQASLTPQQTAAYLRTLPAIRERCSRVHALAQEGKLQYFEYHPDKESDVADFCIELMKVCAEADSDGNDTSNLCISAISGQASTV